MAETTGIEWADATFNFWQGCQAVSPACDHCYAEVRAKRFGKDFGVRQRTSADNWREPLRWDRKAQKAGVRRRVFTLSLGDFWDNQVDPAWRLEALDVVRKTPNLDWLILTKRPQNILKMLKEALARAETWALVAVDDAQALVEWLRQWLDGAPPANVWLGTTVENQEEADRRIHHLLAVPARVRFLSCELLLGPVDLRYLQPGDPPVEINALAGTHGVLRPHRGTNARIDWVICGGESGPGARPMNPVWARSLRDQCDAAGVPYFFKQWGEFAPVGHVDRGPATDPTEFGWERVGTKRAGDMLDGRQHHDWPLVAA